MAPITKFIVATAAMMLASPIMGAPVAKPDALAVRQLHGEGVALDALFTDTDNGVGYGVENAEDNTATLLGGSPTPGGGTRKRQADKMANGAAAILNAVNQPAAANEVQTNGDNLDGDLTDAAANLGTTAGASEEQTLEDTGSAIP